MELQAHLVAHFPLGHGLGVHGHDPLQEGVTKLKIGIYGHNSHMHLPLRGYFNRSTGAPAPGPFIENFKYAQGLMANPVISSL